MDLRKSAWKGFLPRLALTAVVVMASVGPLALDAQAACTGNTIVCENQNPGTPQTTWDTATKGGDSSIVGFTTDISYNLGDTVTFKISTPATAYTIDIYRMGYYQGNGARKITSISPSVALPQTQPGCLTDANTGLVDCGNWSASAAWTVPTTAVSGIYFAKLTRTDTGGSSHIVFVVRNDASTSAILMQTDDTTWQAYNQFGGNSLYMGSGPGGGSQPGRAYKVSYNRPFATRGQQQGYGASNFVFYGEYPAVRFLEANGYDISYFAGLDTDRRGALIKNHKTFMSVAHDEYWTGNQRTNVEAARDAGVNLIFFSGNEMYWKMRLEPSTDGSNTPNRTLVGYKESLANSVIDPQDPTTWTGLWRDPRFSPPADGGRPENGVTGTIFMVNRGSAAITVPTTYSKLRFWRNTAVANATGTVTLGTQTLGYEWDEDLDNPTVTNTGPAARPAGLFDLSSTSVTTADLLLDYGSTTSGGNSAATHHLTMYRAPSGALVFGAGTVQWVWGLDAHHDTDVDTGPAAPDVNMQQATVNLLADMGAQPTTLQTGLVATTASTDTTPPSSTITAPANAANIAVGTNVTISGTASDTGGVVAGVEVSTDGGVSWHPATGTTSWSYAWNANSGGAWTIKVRAADDSGNMQSVPSQITVNVTGDTTSPVVSNVTASTSATGATIGWTTNEPATSQVQYGTTTAYGSSTTLDNTLITNHNQGISGLSAATTYNYRIISKDNAGNTTTTGNFSFTTSIPPTLVRVGDQGIESHTDNNTTGSAEAFQYTATTTGAATRLYMFLDGTSTASTVVVGLYADTNNSPGTLLAQGNITTPQAGNWNFAGIPSVNVTAGNKYWIAVLAPNNATGIVQFRDMAVGGASVVSSQTTLTSLPATWSTGSSWTNAPMSAYAVNFGGSVDTTPPTVSISSPASGATVTGTSVTVAATATDPDSPVSSVQFLLDGSVLGAPVTTAPFQITWDSTKASNGPHTLGAQASDPSGNVGTAAGISVTVSNVDSVPPVISGVASSKISATQATITWTTDKSATSQVDYGTTSAYGTSTTLDNTLVVTHSQTLANLTPSTTYHFRVDSKNGSGFGSSSADFTFTTLAAPACPCTIFSSTSAPVTASAADTQQVEVGVRFQSDNDGYINGIRFYKGAANTGAHIGNLWTDGGTLLASATFSGETASGWQQVNFGAPVKISGGTTYVASYHTSSGGYAADANALATGVNNGSMHALANSTEPNGVFLYGTTSAFPTQTFSATNYWVDVVFSMTPPTLTLSNVGSSNVSSSSALITWSTSASSSSQVFYGTTASYGSSTTLDSTAVSSHSQTVSGLTANTTYHYQVQSKDSFGNVATSADNTFITAATTQTCPCTIWSSTAAPTNPSANDTGAVEVGVKFQSDTPGYISGVRFYKGTANTGTHVGNLWSSTGTLLASATFSGETASGWQQVSFGTPVSISANTTYVASYHMNAGGYAADASFFSTSGVDNSPMHALSNAAAGGNGVFAYGAGSTFPNQTFSSTNYWVDAVFTTTPPALSISTVASGSIGSTGATITWSTSVPSTSQVLYGTTTAYGSSTTLDNTLVPSHSQALTGLTASSTYHYKVQSKDSGGNLVSSADNTFTTTAAATCPCSIWTTTTVPTNPSIVDPNAVEVGVKFTADRAGQITGIRFYKGSGNTGTHIGHLWTSTGTLLASGTFSGETATGWQTLTFTAPVNITANTTYIASYHMANGGYAGDDNYFATGVDKSPLHVASSAASGGNGVFAYGANGVFPNQTFNSTNYWVDVLFK